MTYRVIVIGECETREDAESLLNAMEDQVGKNNEELVDSRIEVKAE